MSRRRSSNTGASLPVPAPENIATREYYHASETNDAHVLGRDDIDYPDSRPNSPAITSTSTGVPGSQSGRTQAASPSRDTATDTADEYVNIVPSPPPSPSPSDIVSRCDLEDTKDMAGLERTTRELPRAERKKMLLDLQEKLRADRNRWVEEGRSKTREELDAEYGPVELERNMNKKRGG